MSEQRYQIIFGGAWIWEEPRIEQYFDRCIYPEGFDMSTLGFSWEQAKKEVIDACKRRLEELEKMTEQDYFR